MGDLNENYHPRRILRENGYSVSDHCPVMCIYEIGQGPYLSSIVRDFFFFSFTKK